MYSDFFFNQALTWGVDKFIINYKFSINDNTINSSFDQCHRLEKLPNFHKQIVLYAYYIFTIKGV
jgi:hypothetical protein